MSLFSERNGFTKKPIQLESMTPELRNRIWNTYCCEICLDEFGYFTNYLEEIMDELGLPFSGLNGTENLQADLQVFRKWFVRAEWYQIYDFVEVYLCYLPPKARKVFSSMLLTVTT